jgi:DedD protein
MDEVLKARLIGAAVLVAIAVLLIPELLSGRKTVEPVAEEAGPRGSRTFTIELGGGAGQSVRTPTTVTPASAPEPLPSPPTPAATVAAPVAEPATTVETDPPPAEVAATPVEREPVPAAAAATAPTAAEPAPAPARAPSRGGWAVQVGAFGSADTAAKLVRDLSDAGYRAFVSPVARGGKTLHRVRVGPEAEKAGAQQMAGRLKARGLPATVVQNE